MENLIKTKKLETRFFLTNSQNPQAIAKPQIIQSIKTKETKDLLNLTAPINFNMSGIGHNTAIFLTSKNHLNQKITPNLNQTQQFSETFCPQRLSGHTTQVIPNQKCQTTYFVQGKPQQQMTRYTSHGKRMSSGSKLSKEQGSNNLRAKWTRGIATQANSKNNSPSCSFRSSSKVTVNTSDVINSNNNIGTSLFAKNNMPYNGVFNIQNPSIKVKKYKQPINNKDERNIPNDYLKHLEQKKDLLVQIQSPNLQRNIKTAVNQRRVSSQVSSPIGTPYDFNKIKQDLESVRQRHEVAQQAKTNNYFNDQQLVRNELIKEKPREVSQQNEFIVFSTKNSLDEYEIGKQIGQGAYAIVRIGKHIKTNKKVALKIYEKEKMKEIQRKKSVRREIKLMERLNHPHIAKLYEAIETDSQVILVLEYISGGSSHGFLKSKPNRRMSEDEARRIFRQVVSALQYCHSKCVTHRDIKLENIMLDSRGNVKIIDFGFSTCIPNDKKIKLFCGTPSYMAPEIVAKKEFCGPPADVWASGILLYAFFCGCFPFRGQNDKDLYKKIQKAELIIPEHVPQGPIQLLLKILQIEPEKRPQASELYCDQWVQGINVMTDQVFITKNRSYSTSAKQNEILNQLQISKKNSENRQQEKSKNSQNQQKLLLSNNNVNSFLQQTNITGKSPTTNYDTEAYKAYYNTAGSPQTSNSPRNRIGSMPYMQQQQQQQQNIYQSPNKRLFINFQPNNPHQTINNNINIINNITQINYRTSSGVNLFSTTNSDDNLNSNVGGQLSSNSSFDNEILNNMTKLGMTQDEIKKQLIEGNDQYISTLYMKMKNDKKFLNNPIYPSFVPSMLSSFGSPKNSLIQNNWQSGLIMSQEEQIASILNSTGPLASSKEFVSNEYSSKRYKQTKTKHDY